MLKVTMKPKIPTFNRKLQPQDIITYRWKEVTIYNEDGTKTIKRVCDKVNVTKKVNESKKLIKTYTAEQKLQEIDKISKL